MQCMANSSIDSTLRQISYGFPRRITTYGCYDVNGYRFRSEKYESAKSGLSTVNTGVCVSCVDDDNNVIDYFGVIEDIIKITWEGSTNLELVLFDCRWLDPTNSGVRRTENLGLVEVNHTSRLSNFEPFVLASQVTQVYYLPYPCDSRPDLKDWWVVHNVTPHGWLPPSTTNESAPPNDQPQIDTFYQEEGLEGHFVIDLGDDIEIATTYISDEITNEKDLDYLAKCNSPTQGDEELDDEEDDEEDEEEAEPEAIIYDPEDF